MAAPEHPEGFIIAFTAKELWERLDRIETAVSGVPDLKEKVAQVQKASEDRDRELETRVRSLEKYRWMAAGFAAAAGGGAGSILSQLIR